MAVVVAKQYGNALPGTSGTPSATNRYVTDGDPRLATIADIEAEVASLEDGAVTVQDLLGLVRWLCQRVTLLEAVVGTSDAIEPPAEAGLLDTVGGET